MLLELITAKKIYYPSRDKEEIEKLEEDGFEFNSEFNKVNTYLMLANKPVFVNITSLEDILYFLEKYGDLILQWESLIIYNDYIE